MSDDDGRRDEDGTAEHEEPISPEPAQGVNPTVDDTTPVAASVSVSHPEADAIEPDADQPLTKPSPDGAVAPAQAEHAPEVGAGEPEQIAGSDGAAPAFTEVPPPVAPADVAAEGAALNDPGAAPTTPPVPPVLPAPPSDAAGAPQSTAGAVPPAPGTPPAPGAPPVPPAPGTSTATRPGFFDPKRLGFAAIGGAIAVGGALVAAVVLVLLTLLFGLISGANISDALQGFGNTDVPGFQSVLWIAVLNLFGQLSVSVAAGGLASASIVGGGIPFLGLVTAFGAAAWWSHRLERQDRSSRGGVWVLGAAAGLAAAILVLLLSIIGRYSVDASTAGVSVGVSVSTLSVGSFFGPLITVALASVFGRWLARGESERSFWSALWHVPSRFWGWARDIYDYAAVVTVIFVPLALVVTIVAGDGALSSWPLGVGQWTVATIAVAHLGGVGVSALAVGQGMSETYSLFGDASPWWWIAFLFAVIAAALAAIVIAARRRSHPVPLQRAWILPVGALVVALVVALVFGTAYAAGGLGVMGSGSGFSAQIAPAWWTYFLALLWGAAVEALARFVAPTILATVPALAKLTTGPRSASDAPVATAAQGHGVAEAGATAPANDAAPAPAAKPLSPAAKKRLAIGGIVIGAVALLVIAGAVTVSILKATVFSPKPAVEAYLDDIANGRFADAFAAGPGTSTGATALVKSNEVTLADGITDVSVGDGTETGDSITFDISYEVAGQRETGQITVESTGSQAVFFDSWDLSSGLETTAYVSGADLIVGGVEIPDSLEGAEFIAYPGVYETEAVASQWEDVTVEPLTVSGFGGQVQAETSPSPALADEISRQVNEHIDDCAASTELDPEDCPFRAYTFGEVRDVAWTVVDYPVVEVGSYGSFSAAEGEVTVTYERQTFSDDWEADEYTSSVTVWGQYVVEGDTVSVTY